MSVSGHSYSSGGGALGGEFDRFVRRTRPTDAASDTSSQQERNFANLLGGVDDRDEKDLGGGGGAHLQNVGHRLYHVGTEKQRNKNELLREEREKTLMKEMSSLAQRPAITAQARERPPKGHTFADHSKEWQTKRDEKVFRKMLESRDRDESEVTAMPTIDSNSLSILENAGTYVDPVGGWDTHYAKYCAKQGQPLPRSMFVPNINANAVRAEADKKIHDRLHEDSVVRTDRLRDAAKEQRRRELEDPATGRPYFSPQSLRAPMDSGFASPDRDESVISRLHDSSKKVLAQRDPESGNPGISDPEATFNPKINPRSAELADRVRRPLYTPGKKKDWAEEKAQLEDAALQNSSSRSGSKVQLDEFFRRTNRCDHVKEARLESLRREKAERENEHCAFQPRINKRSEELFKQAHVYGKPMTMPTSAPEISTNMTAGRMQMEAGGFSSGSTSPINYSDRRSSQQKPISVSHSQEQPQQYASQYSTPRSARQQQQQPSSKSRDYQPAAVATQSATPRNTGVHQHQADMSAGSELQGADEYMSNFENQMNAVLDEWRRLEEV